VRKHPALLCPTPTLPRLWLAAHAKRSVRMPSVDVEMLTAITPTHPGTKVAATFSTRLSFRPAASCFSRASRLPRSCASRLCSSDSLEFLAADDRNPTATWQSGWASTPDNRPCSALTSGPPLWASPLACGRRQRRTSRLASPAQTATQRERLPWPLPATIGHVSWFVVVDIVT
jgi:hypothetical protein